MRDKLLCLHRGENRTAAQHGEGCQRAVSKAFNLPNSFDGPSDGPVLDRDDPTLCCTSSSKPCFDVNVVSCSICFVSRSRTCCQAIFADSRLATALAIPGYTHTTTPAFMQLRRSFCCVTIGFSRIHAVGITRSMRWTGAGAAVSLLLSCLSVTLRQTATYAALRAVGVDVA